ncbi:MAG: glycerol-3-phosphate dehydrogenase/oxidase [Anaerolineae bacterium]|nr:MAG: glycerol-3-phosphate dehydrogenase/oxidase [Anaerolineae bacterium]
MLTREETLERLRAEPALDVLVVGGGINGAGVLRDLALNGVRVLLVDRSDFCGGASAASSHMVHGGLRYLENGEFRLVHEALIERNRLLANAPDFVVPLETVVPIERLFSGVLNAPMKFLGLRDRPAERGALVVKIGLMLYDWYARRGNPMPRHRMYGEREVRSQFPQLGSRVRWAATYFDSLMPLPERLCWHVLRDGLETNGAGMALNYCSVIGGEQSSVILKDEESGETLGVQPRMVINAAGAWIDRVNERLGAATKWIGGTKGSHLVVDHLGLVDAVGGREFFFENADGRIVLICPLGNRALVGTTDIRIEDADEARCTEEETDYLLGMIGRVFPDIDVREEHIVYHFSGVRPLPVSEAGRTGGISRDHSLPVLEAEAGRSIAVMGMVGGKWTTFRAFAEQAADEALRRLGRTRAADTQERSIGKGDEVAAGLTAGQYELSDVLLLQICLEERVVHLDDLALRRVPLGMLGALTEARIGRMADAAAGALGWDAGRKTAEMARLKGILEEKHGV